MNEALDFIKCNPIGEFATIGRDGKPKVRPFGFYLEKDGNLWFVTSADKEVYQELLANQYIEFCTRSPQMAWLRLRGAVVFTDDMDIKTEIFNIAKTSKQQYGTPDNPNFKPFCLKQASATLYKFGAKPQEFTFNM
ncbi:pyridoxamine 5'-phosphate oxidase family protein [Clostridium beijerinckii]|uniref:pyridoxamine 5'-phosphate oxidase family protein n=1 Tax=Clostridium beijerinckii TaxID=1520 RepID=UPI00047DC275|nr:pyridoxamine 5'-phosphate oxidase family protein [Clostridium beijerinckii]